MHGCPSFNRHAPAELQVFVTAGQELGSSALVTIVQVPGVAPLHVIQTLAAPHVVPQQTLSTHMLLWHVPPPTQGWPLADLQVPPPSQTPVPEQVVIALLSGIPAAMFAHMPIDPATLHAIHVAVQADVQQ